MVDFSLLRLRLIHARLAREVAREQAARVPDRFRLLQLKKLKLAVKDRLTRSRAPRLSPA